MKKEDIQIGKEQHEGAVGAEFSVHDGCNRFQQG